MTAATGATEITLRGWDIAAAAGGSADPDILAVVLPAAAPLLPPAGTRPGMPDGPVPRRGPACPGSELAACPGRRPVPRRFRETRLVCISREPARRAPQNGRQDRT
jgi:hypothetical protein